MYRFECMLLSATTANTIELNRTATKEMVGGKNVKKIKWIKMEICMKWTGISKALVLLNSIGMLMIETLALFIHLFICKMDTCALWLWIDVSFRYFVSLFSIFANGWIFRAKWWHTHARNPNNGFQKHFAIDNHILYLCKYSQFFLVSVRLMSVWYTLFEIVVCGICHKQILHSLQSFVFALFLSCANGNRMRVFASLKHFQI